MPSASVKNPNVTSKNRLSARAAKHRSRTEKSRAAAALSKVAKADTKRGARAGLLPTSGPNKPLSAKRRRKLEKKMGYAEKRKMEAEGEVEMKDAAEADNAEGKAQHKAEDQEEKMAVDAEGIS